MYRAAELMQQVWRLFSDLDGDRAHRIVVRTRMSASVFFDCLWTLREEVGIRSAAPVILYQRLPVDADNDDEEEQADFQNQPLRLQSQEQKFQLAQKPTTVSVVSRPGNRLKPNSTAASLASSSDNNGGVGRFFNTDSTILTPAASVSNNVGFTDGNGASSNSKSDMFFWDADVIFKDVDSLMTDFGFGEEEAPQK